MAKKLEKEELIGLILVHLRGLASLYKKPFDEGDTFFQLSFKTYDELRKIAKEMKLIQ